VGQPVDGGTRKLSPRVRATDSATAGIASIPFT
jgi:hypothetical protein